MLKRKFQGWGFIKDPLYGYIMITEDDKQLIDSIEFQRIHRIKQLPLAELVYPAATHTRFEHSLGVMHLATLMMENLPHEIEEYDAKLVRFSALLHDVGHGPFSHIFEHFTLKKLSLNHEEIGKEIILRSSLGDILKSYGINPVDIGDIITGNRIFLKKYLHQIIKSGIDADKLDFIKRDNFHSGAGYGNIDIDRLVTTMDTYEEELAINITSLLTFELFIIARIKSFEAIYFHKTLRAAQLLLIKAIENAIEEFGLLNSFNINDYINLDDYSLWVLAKNSKYGKKFIQKIERRELPKLVYEKKVIIKGNYNELLKKIEEIKEHLILKSKLSEEEIFFDLSVLPSVPYHNAYLTDPLEIPVVKMENGKKAYKLTEISSWLKELKGYINIFRIYTEKKYKDYLSEICKQEVENLI